MSTSKPKTELLLRTVLEYSVPLIVIAIMGVIFFNIYPDVIEINNRNKQCESQTIIPQDICKSEGRLMCYNQCNELGKKYFNYEWSSGIFSGTEKNCFCVDEFKEVDQIW